MCRRLREQARSHRFFVSYAEVVTPTIPCGSGLARESGGSVCDDIGCADTFASKLAPTGFCVVCRGCDTHNPMWERACSRKRWFSHIVARGAPLLLCFGS
ncbi:hypothetical protein CD58_03395 [Pseudomonas brassicacearum]|nr:hypothetical protein CD58_03395 [Pseudomonas brassicacearum]